MANLINDIKDHIQHKTYDFIQYKVINPKTIDPDNFITIVMTTHNRKTQTLYTLSTFQQSKLSETLAVILVDDSTEGFCTDTELSQFNFQITYITIEFSKKNWINSCVNYNIGFQEIQTNKVIIQNAEVCHCGDIIQHAFDHVTMDKYIVYDVCSIGHPTIDSLKVNQMLYQLKDYNDVHKFVTQYKWYQHWTHRCRNLHFLTGITRDNLIKLNGFDYDFALGTCFDDNEFIYRIVHVLKLSVFNVHNEDTSLLGVHQWHPRCPLSYDSHYYEINKSMMLKKYNGGL